MPRTFTEHQLAEQRKYQRMYGVKRREQSKQRTRARQQRTANFQIYNEFKSQPCVDCGKTYPPAAMDCDHVRGEKLGLVSAMLLGSHAVLRAELEKCEPRCANCHRLRHAREKAERKAA